MLSTHERMSDCRLSVPDPGERPGTPPSLFLDQTEAQRAENVFFFGDQPSSLSQGLNPALVMVL